MLWVVGWMVMFRVEVLEGEGGVRERTSKVVGGRSLDGIFFFLL